MLEWLQDVSLHSDVVQLQSASFKVPKLIPYPNVCARTRVPGRSTGTAASQTGRLRSPVIQRLAEAGQLGSRAPHRSLGLSGSTY